MLEITVQNDIKAPIDELLLFNACQIALGAEEITSAEIDILIVDDARMLEMNTAYLAHEYTTDVLSFDLGETPDGGRMGQLVVCADYAAREAQERGIAEREELARYVIHGTLHILGYDDHDPSDKAEMWAVQETLVNQLLGK